MDTGIKVVIGVVVIAVLGLPLVSTLVEQEGAEKGATETAAQPAPAKPGPPATQNRPPMPKLPSLPPPSPGAAPGSLPPGVPNRPPQLNARNLVGSVWSVQGATITLQANGIASATHPQYPGFTVQGTWSISGSILTLSAMGQTEKVRITGSDVYARGNKIQRIK